MAKKKHVPAILLLDENTKRRQNLSSRLRLNPGGEFVVEAGLGGFHCLHLLEKQKFDLIIIIDEIVDMPTHEVIGMVRTSHKTPILYMSEEDNLLEYKNYFTLGATACEQLTSNFNEMLASINGILGIKPD